MTVERPVTVVNIISPSYSGTTWLGLLLGASERVFHLGAPDRVWQLRHAPDSAASCRVHGAECPFWTRFWAARDPADSFYAQLAQHSGRDTIVINNPSTAHAAAELEHPALRVLPVHLVRDGRAITASYTRHHDVDFIEAVRAYSTGMYAAFAGAGADEAPFLRYEELVADQAGHLDRLGAAIDVEYSAAALRFWEFDQHVTSGNAGAIQLLRMLQGLPVQGKQRPFYEAQAERLRAGAGPFADTRAEDELGPRERFAFDLFCGADNARWGYEPDRFSTEERRRFLRDLGPELRPRRTALRLAGQRAVREGRASLARLSRRRRQLLGLAAALWGLTVIATIVLTWIALALRGSSGT